MVSGRFGCFIFRLLTNPELGLQPVGNPPPEEEEEDLEDEKEAPRGSQEPSDGGGGAKPTLLAQVCHLLPRCMLTRPQRANPGARQARNGDVDVGK